MARLRARRTPEPAKKVSYSDSQPQFFKIFVPHHCSKRLRIPPAFVKHLPSDLPLKSTLVTPARRSWQVDVSKLDDDVYFHHGWDEFVKDNILEFGDFMVFSYDGLSKFFVILYGKNNCRKDIAVSDDKVGKQATNFDGNDLSDSEDQVVQLDDSEEMAPSPSPSENNFIDIKLCRSYVKKGFVHLPSDFYKIATEVRLAAKLQRSNKTWVVKMPARKPLRFSQGWTAFVRDNNLQADDICRLELVDTERDSYVMNVSVLRSSNHTISKEEPFVVNSNCAKKKEPKVVYF